MNYIILWQCQGNDGTEQHHTVVSEGNLQGRLNSIANNDGKLGGAWGNTNIECYELGNKVKIEISTVANIVRS